LRPDPADKLPVGAGGAALFVDEIGLAAALIVELRAMDGGNEASELRRRRASSRPARVPDRSALKYAI
jgi:hypothetical protein